MAISHLMLVLVVILIWGCNFLFIEFALRDMHPLLLCTLRFVLASFPAILFIKPPKASFKLVVTYGLLTFAIQFALLFMGMYAGVTPGLASLILQVQIFFSLFFAAVLLNEKPALWQLIGAMISFSGIIVVGLHLDNSLTWSGFLLVIAAAASWGLGNLVAKKMPHVNMIALVVWGSFAACFPLLFATLLFEGVTSMQYTFQHITWLGFLSVLYIVYASTWIGYGGWNWILSRYPVATVVPFTLLVPVVGMLSSIIVLGESFEPWKLFAGVLVITGICVNLLGARFFVRRGLKTDSV